MVSLPGFSLPQESHGALKAAERRELALGQNINLMTHFILLRFSEHPELQVILFSLFLGIFFMTLVWKLGLIVLIAVESHLHSPMYFFLGNLSFIDVSYTSSIAPKTLCDFFREQKTISLMGCAAQFFFFIGMGTRSAASWQPWRTIGSPPCAALQPSLLCAAPPALRSPPCSAQPSLLCAALVTPPSVCGWPSQHTLEASSPDWSRPDLYPGSNSAGYGSFTTFSVTCHPCWSCLVSAPSSAREWPRSFRTSALVVLVCYGYIIAAVTRIRSTPGWTKAFNTCASHLITVTLFYGPGLFAYLHSGVGYSLGLDMVVSLFCGVVSPKAEPHHIQFEKQGDKRCLEKTQGKKPMFTLCLIVPWIKKQFKFSYMYLGIKNKWPTYY